MGSDPTRAILDSLTDQAKWVCLPNVPVFDEHREYSATGELIRDFTPEKLADLAREQNLREEATGTLTLIGPGHTIPDYIDASGKRIREREDNQPPSWGVARNYHVGTFGPSNKVALLCDYYVAREHYAEFLTYPHRSIELYPIRREIPRISSIRVAPERSLGLITEFAPPVSETDLTPLYLTPNGPVAAYQMQRGKDLCLYYAIGATMPEPEAKPESKPEAKPEEGNEMSKMIEEYLSKSPIWQYAMKCYQADGGGAAPAGAPAAAPSATNGSLPGAPEKREEVDRMQRDQQAIQYARQEERLKALEARNAELTLQYQRQVAEREVIQLEAEGYTLDRAKEIIRLAPLSDEARKGELEHMRQYYRQDKNLQFFPVADGSAGREGGKRPNAPIDRETCTISERELLAKATGGK